MKVAKIIDCYTLAITKTDVAGIGRGDILCICDRDIIDPETGETLGQIPGLRVKITDVYDKFVIAETYSITHDQVMFSVNVGDDVQPLRR